MAILNLVITLASSTHCLLMNFNSYSSRHVKSERFFLGFELTAIYKPVEPPNLLHYFHLTFGSRCVQELELTIVSTDVIFSSPLSYLSGCRFSTLPASVLGQEMFQKAGKGSKAEKPLWHDEPPGPLNDLAGSTLILFSKALNFDLKSKTLSKWLWCSQRTKRLLLMLWDNIQANGT